MNIEIYPGKTFIKKVKRLAKKYHSLVTDLKKFEEELKDNPNEGVDLGNGLRKVRMSIADKGRGKSHGARVIIHSAIISIDKGRIVLLTIYDKAEQESISDKELKELLAELAE